MALKLKPGTELIFAIKQDERGFILLQRIKVGRTERPRKGAKAKRYRTEELLAQGIEEIGQRWLASIGLEKTK